MDHALPFRGPRLAPALRLLGLALWAAPLFAAGAPCKPAEAGRPAIGLVLSGGGARGLAHVGVLRVLEELEVPIDCITGTSMGALVGGFYAAGWSPDQIERELLAIDWRELFRGEAPRRNLSFRRKEDDLRYIDFEAGLRKGRLATPRGAAAGGVLDFLLRSKTLWVAGISDFDRLPIPFRAVAADLTTGEEVVFDHGELGTALRASMSIPGVFPPVEVGDRILVDGYVLNNLPIEAARALGADIVIAVDVSTPMLKREQLASITGIASQALSLAAQRRVDAQKRDADVLLEPELTGVSLLDFTDLSGTVRRGEAAARGAVERLRPLADRQAFAAQKARQRGRAPVPERLRSVEVEGTPRVDARRLRGRIASRPGAALDLDLLRHDLGTVLEIGEFDRVDLDFSRREEGVDLVFRPHDNGWGPLYLHGGLNISDDLEGHNGVDLLVGLTRTSLNALGAEWRTDLQMGQTRRIASELYQPLTFGGRWFAALGFEHRREVSDVFAESGKIAEYEVESLIGSLDLGLQLGEYGELRVGVKRGTAEARPDVGATDLPALDVEAGGWAARLLIDRLDNAAIPRHGEYLQVEGFRAEPSLGSDLRYDKLSASYWHFDTVGRQTWFTTLSAGTSLGGDLPAYDEFLLGGLLSFSGYRRGELRGQYFGVARFGYLYRLSELPELLGSGIYLGGWVEGGNVWQTSEVLGEDLIYTAAVAAAAETRLGTLFIGYGVADDRKDSYFLTLGQRF